VNLFTEIKFLVEKDLLLELRQRYALHGMMLYIVSTVFVCYMSFRFSNGEIHPITWNTLFWIIMLFTAVNAIAKSFVQEGKGRLLYYYTLVSPQSVILSKIIYNALLMLVLSIVGLAVYSLIIGNPVQDMALFVINVILGGLGFSSAFTMISAIASKAANGGTLMAILGFPVILPMLIMLIKISKNAMDGLALSNSYDELITLGAINMIVVTISYLLFPYLWRT
jgi:heme exporter protein B